MYSAEGLKPWQSEKWVPEGYAHRGALKESTAANASEKLHDSDEEGSQSSIRAGA